MPRSTSGTGNAVRRALPAALGATLILLTGCGGSGGSKSSPSARSTPASANPSITGPTGSSTTQTTSTPANPGPSPTSADAGSNVYTCPSDADVSKATGLEMISDPAPPHPAAGFCPYLPADQKSPVADINITYSAIDVTADPSLASTSESIAGLGTVAYWNAGSGELLVRAGGTSVIVDLLVFGTPPFDEKAVAIELAQLALAQL